MLLPCLRFSGLCAPPLCVWGQSLMTGLGESLCPVHAGHERSQSFMCCPHSGWMLPNSLVLQAQMQGLGVEAHRHHLCCPPDSASSTCSGSPTFEGQMCAILQHPGLLGRSTLVELYVIYWLQIEEERKISMLALILHSCLYLWGSVSRSSFLFHLSLCLSFHQFHTVLITAASQ